VLFARFGGRLVAGIAVGATAEVAAGSTGVGGLASRRGAPSRYRTTAAYAAGDVSTRYGQMLETAEAPQEHSVQLNEVGGESFRLVEGFGVDPVLFVELQGVTDRIKRVSLYLSPIVSIGDLN
jgi:hypothetical protein